MGDDELIVEQLLLGPMENFVYIIGSKSTREVALIDPAWDIDALLDRLDEMDYKLTAALVTHYHPDHIGGDLFGNSISGLSELMARRPVKVYANKAEADGVRKVSGISAGDISPVGSGDTLDLGPVEVEFLHTPGHTPGSQCFRIKNTLVSGDTLFINGCGRVDLPGSDPEQMYHSLAKLRELPDDTMLLPGHNYGQQKCATMGETKAHNHYLNMPDLETWKRMMG